ncbi:MAG: imidazolonepropionase [Candidatus Latescibacteria bacterium]|nr:imidazolonepropionase [Candidatus Latescibacterota bacterium]NIM21016.1 imidazolonepropionase [Candidatus Latescibacterota bacterium]NIM65151.1 imidazolonepropionase [Candidatus Latescibacterota bacterium]NIO01666.1 imidazolonepropionase [Candidatus Latescibacterota bacterium]NIO28183.1 imidazolonepropionase [Candidatus Latescibacterota bacterium]
MKQEADLLVSNCRQLLTLQNPSVSTRRGRLLGDLGLVQDGMIAAYHGRIVAAGPESKVTEQISFTPGGITVDAGHSVVMPGFVDCHTHTVFANYRLDEYEWRIAGRPYAEIAKAGGGIAKSVSDVRGMSEKTLLAVSRKRLNGCISNGSTTIEIKSGYGLDLENELKQLRVIRELDRLSPVTIVPTFCGAHSVPPEYAQDREAYIDLVVNEMIPVVAKEGLAEYVDVFCETGVFTVPEAERILRAAVELGLKARLHADELSDVGAADLAVRLTAISADHLTKISPSTVVRLADSSVIAVLLPGTSFGLPSLQFAPAREMVNKGVAIAIASDFNPGSSPSESMSMMIAIACSHMRLSPAEAIAAATYNAAFVVGREREVGSLEVGKRADFLILDCEDYREIPYRFGINPVRQVFVGGRLWSREDA